MKKPRRWLPIVAGIAVLLLFVGIGAVVVGVSWVREHLDIIDASETDATREFEAVLAKFPGQQPLIEMRDGVPHYTDARASQPPSTIRLTTLHVLAWDSDDDQLARVDVPFWLLRMKSGPIAFSGYASGLDEAGVNLTAEDIERHGPGILLDVRAPREGRVLLWAE